MAQLISLSKNLSDDRKVKYQCPQCGSLKKPKIVQYFPPITVECLDCKMRGPEKKFIKEEQARNAPIHYIH